MTLIEELPKDWWDIYGQRDELGEQMDALDMRSVIYVPIRSQQDGTIFGALTCILAGTDPRVTYTTEETNRGDLARGLASEDSADDRSPVSLGRLPPRQERGDDRR